MFEVSPGNTERAELEELFDRCSGDLDSFTMFDGFSSQYLYGLDEPSPCPWELDCSHKSAECGRSIITGITSECRVTADLGHHLDIKPHELNFERR
jgi:hypothetical protein